jgi:hypothetical protein
LALKSDSPDLVPTMTYYCELMQEIKIRDQSISDLSGAHIPAQVAYESAYLQLRMICELISIACLVIHGDIPATTQKLKKSWSADEIIKRLSEIHADFYPNPVYTPPDNKFQMVAVTEGFLEKSELLLLYGKCGDRLHRGTAKNARNRITPHNVSFVQVQRWRERITKLLSHHWITLYGSSDKIGVQMGNLMQQPFWNYWAPVNPPETPPQP